MGLGTRSYSSSQTRRPRRTIRRPVGPSRAAARPSRTRRRQSRRRPSRRVDLRGRATQRRRHDYVDGAKPSATVRASRCSPAEPRRRLRRPQPSRCGGSGSGPVERPAPAPGSRSGPGAPRPQRRRPSGRAGRAVGSPPAGPSTGRRQPIRRHRPSPPRRSVEPATPADRSHPPVISGRSLPAGQPATPGLSRPARPTGRRRRRPLRSMPDPGPPPLHPDGPGDPREPSALSHTPVGSRLAQRKMGTVPPSTDQRSRRSRRSPARSTGRRSRSRSPPRSRSSRSRGSVPLRGQRRPRACRRAPRPPGPPARPRPPRARLHRARRDRVDQHARRCVRVGEHRGHQLRGLGDRVGGVGERRPLSPPTTPVHDPPAGGLFHRKPARRASGAATPSVQVPLRLPLLSVCSLERRPRWSRRC